MNELSMVANFFKEGGVPVYFILATGVVILAIAAERFVVIQKAASLNGRKFTDDLVQAARRGDLTTARQLARVSNAPVAQVAQAVLQHADGDHAMMQAAADDAATLALPALTRRLGQLSLLANVATLLGLLGTISGLITAFAGVGAADPAQRSAFLAAGISTGLNATALGLLIAVPALLLHGWLVGMVESVSEQVDEVGIRLANAILVSRGQHAVAVPAAHGQRLAADGAPAMAPRVAAGGAR